MRQVVRFAKRWYWTSIIIGTVAPGSIAALIMYIATDGVTGWLPVVAAVLGGLLTAGVLSLIGGHEPTNQPGSGLPSIPTPFSQGKVFSPRTPDELVNEVKGLTDIRRQHVIQLHLGEWLHVAGCIRDVQQISPGDEIKVSVALKESGVTAFMVFVPSYWQASLQAANIGDTISANGRIKNVEFFLGYGSVTLDECELVDLKGNLPTS